MERIEGLSIGLDLDSAGLNRGLTGLKDKLRTVNSEMKANLSAFDRSERSVAKYETILTGLNRKIEVQEAVTKSARQEYEKMVREHGEGSAEAEKAARSYNNEVAALNTLRRRIESTQRQLADFREEQRTTESSLTSLGQSMNRTGESVTGLGENMKNLGSFLTTGLTAPITGFGLAAGKTALDFDRASGSIQAELGITEKQADKLNEVAKKLWKDGFGDSIDGISSKISGVTKSLGDLSKVDLSYVTKGLDLFEQKGWGDQQEALRAIKVLMEQFGMSASQAMDYLTKGFQENLDFSGEFLDSVSEYSTYFAEFGMTSDDMFAKFKSGADSGVFQLDKIGDSMKEMSLRAKDGSKTSTEAYKALGLNAKEMTKQFNKGGEDAKKAFIKVVKALQNTDDETKRNLVSTGLWGTQYEDLGEKAFDAMLEASSGLKDVEGATKKASDAIRDNFGTRATKVWRDFVADMEPAGEILLDIAEDVLPKVADTVSDVTNAFADLSPEGKKTILAIGGIAAAAGPATMALGSFSTGIGSLIKLGGGLTGLLGKVGGAGLLGRIGLLGVGSTPVGLAIAGVGALGLGVYGLTKNMGENTEEILQSIKARQDELDSMDKLIGQYETLQSKNKLSTDEILRYMDIMSDLKKAKNEESIKSLTDEQNNLLKKSGLTNKEMEEFLGLNDQIVEKSPNSVKAISEQGNAYAGVLDELKKLNAEQRKELTNDTFMAISDERQKQEKSIAKQRDLLKEIDKLENKSKENIQTKIKYGNEVEEKTLEIARLENEISNSTSETKIKLLEKKAVLQDELSVAEGLVAKYKEEEESNQKKIKDKKSSLAETEKELAAYDELLTSYGQQVLYEQGIVSEKGKANEALKQQQSELDASRARLKQLLSQGKIGTAEYEAQNQKLNEQQGKIDIARSKLEQMNQVAGRTVYKDIKVSTFPSIQTINQELSTGVRKQVSIFTALDGNYRRLSDTTAKTVNIKTVGGYHAEPGFATGTRNAPPGMAWTGENGPELIKFNGGEKVIPHNDSMTIMRNWGRDNSVVKSLLGKWNIPMFSKGTTNAPKGLGIINELGRELVFPPTSRLEPSWPSFSLSAATPIKTESMKIIALAGKAIQENRKQVSNENNNGVMNQLLITTQQHLDAAMKQNIILMQLLQKDINVYINRKEFTNEINKQNGINYAMMNYQFGGS